MPSIPIDITIVFHYNIKVDTDMPDDIIYIHAQIRLENIYRPGYCRIYCGVG